MANDISSGLGIRLRLAREAKGLRQEDVADACGVTQQAVQAWEADRSAPRGLQRIAKLAEILGIEPADIRGGGPAVLSKYETHRAVLDSLHANVTDKPLGRILENRPRVEGAQLMATIREEKRAELANCLPEQLRQYVGASLDVRGVPHRFDYLSRRVVGSILYLPVLRGAVSAISLRMALYRIAVANRHYNDFPVPARHYLLAVIPLSLDEVRIPAALLHEGRLFDTLVEVHSDVKSVCAKLVELEEKPTELEEISVPDDWGIDYDPDETPPAPDL